MNAVVRLAVKREQKEEAAQLNAQAQGLKLWLDILYFWPNVLLSCSSRSCVKEADTIKKGDIIQLFPSSTK